MENTDVSAKYHVAINPVSVVLQVAVKITVAVFPLDHLTFDTGLRLNAK